LVDLLREIKIISETRFLVASVVRSFSGRFVARNQDHFRNRVSGSVHLVVRNRVSLVDLLREIKIISETRFLVACT